MYRINKELEKSFIDNVSLKKKILIVFQKTYFFYLPETL